MLKRYDSVGRPRRFVSGHNPTRKSKYHDAIIASLKGGARSLELLAKTVGANRNVLSGILPKMAQAGDIVKVAHGTWALPKTEVNLSLEVARAVADTLLDMGIRMNAARAAQVAAAMRDVANQYEQQWPMGEA